MYQTELENQVKNNKSFTIPLWLKRSRKDILSWIYHKTQDFPSRKIIERVYIVLHGNPPKCSCGNFKKFNTFEKGYRIGCELGNKCLDVTKNRIENQKLTMLERYNVGNASQLESTRQKIKKTNLEKYGVEHHSQNNDIKSKTYRTRKARTTEQLLKEKQKSKNSNLLKYGVEHHMMLQHQRQKVMDTNIQKYGDAFPLQNKSSVEKMQKTFNQHSLLEINKKRKETILEKYGVDSASRIKVPKTTIDILSDNVKFTEFIRGKTREQVIDELKIHDHTLYLYAKKYMVNHLFKKPLVSNFERELSLFLDELKIQYSQNDRTIINPQEIDFYIPTNKLAIECSGLYWHSENSAGRGRLYHYGKLNKCKELDITLLTIFQDEWQNQKEKVKNRIKLSLDIPIERIYARNTIIKEISTNIAKSFIESFHLQTYSQSSIKLGLYKDSELCSVMTFGKSRYNSSCEYELIRYCSIRNVVGGASKMLSYFVNTYKPKNIVSYSDNRYFNGNMYKVLGFTEQKTNIGYYYTDYHARFNRLQFQKHKLIEQGFDKSKSEWQIMQELGYDRIWDCGQTTWTINFDK